MQAFILKLILPSSVESTEDLKGVSEIFRPQKYVSLNRKAVSHTEIALLNVKSIPNKTLLSNDLLGCLLFSMISENK